MNIIFCNISWMKEYNGVSESDQPKHAGLVIKDPSDIFEKDNFSDFNGKCYGYVRSGGSILLDKHFRGLSQGVKSLDGVTVVWCAALNEEESRIVGWYHDATVYRDMVSLPLYEDDYINFSFMADSKNCYLLPEEERTFAIRRSKSSTPQKGASKSNIWYAKSEYGRTEFIPRVMEFIDGYRGEFVHFQVDERLMTSMPEDTLESHEQYIAKAEDSYAEGSLREAIKYYNAAAGMGESYEASLGLAKCYYELNAFSHTVKLVESIMDVHGENKELVELAFISSDFILDVERAARYFRRLNELEGTELTDREYYDYLNEITDLRKTYGQYL